MAQTWTNRSLTEFTEYTEKKEASVTSVDPEIGKTI